MAKLKLAVLFGGVSSEHEVSLVSATAVIKNLSREKYEIIPIGITKKGRWLFYPGDADKIQSGEWEQCEDNVPAIISPDASVRGIVKFTADSQISFHKIDVVFPVLHGKNGEDGTLQGLLALSQIPYVGCDTLSSAACMDKAVTHAVLESSGIPMAPYQVILKTQVDDVDEFAKVQNRLEKSLGYPMFIKPANAGSSVGINKVSEASQLKNAIQIALAHDKKVIAEKAISGAEIECAVMGNEHPVASGLGEIVPQNEFYDYEAKYLLGNTQLYVPARVEPETACKVQQLAVQAYRAMGCCGLARVDFFVDKANGDIILNEVNTLPGFTSISMYPKLFQQQGFSYSELLDQLIEYAFERADNSNG